MAVATKIFDNSGSLGINKRKEQDSHPDRTGKCLIAGVEYWINGWVKETNGEPWLSLSFRRKDGQGQTAALERPRQPEPDIPF